MGLTGIVAARPGWLHMALEGMLKKVARRPKAMKLWVCLVLWLRCLGCYMGLARMLGKAARRPVAMIFVGLPGEVAARPGWLRMSLEMMRRKAARRPVAVKMWTCRVKWLRGVVGYPWVWRRC